MERARGIEPPCSGWEPDALPLSYARVIWLGNVVETAALIKNVNMSLCYGSITSHKLLQVIWHRIS